MTKGACEALDVEACTWISDAFDMGASDLLLCSGHVPRARMSGALVSLDSYLLQPSDVAPFVARFGAPDWLDAGDRERVPPVDCDVGVAFAPYGRLRVSTYRSINGPCMVLRLIPSRLPALVTQMIPSTLYQLTSRMQGLILLGGSTGSGKSTTMRCLVDQLSRAALHIITLEDPIEHVYSCSPSIIDQREVGNHVTSFAAGLRSAVRQAPDVIILGELRDAMSARMAVRAAKIGHLVLATIHAASVVDAIDRLCAFARDTDSRQTLLSVSAALSAVSVQHLLPGVSGRAAAYEIVVNTPAVARMIREGMIHQLGPVMETGRRAGMRSLEFSIRELLSRGVLTEEVADGALHGVSRPRL